MGDAGRVRRPAIADPQAVPVTGTDHALAPVPAHRLLASAVRARMAVQPPWQPEFVGDGIRDGLSPSRRAAVLIALVDRVDGLNVLLTQRSPALRDHAGQISFPGGRLESSDVDAVAAALREAREEIGLEARWVDVLGQLPDYHTVTDYAVTPVVALVRPGFALSLDSGEVTEAFEVPLAHLMNPAGHQRHAFVHEGRAHEFLSMPWRSPTASDGRSYFIWGATAGMLRNLYRLLSA